MKFNYIWPHPKVTSLTLGWKFYLHSVLLVIPVDLICHMTIFDFFFWPPWHPHRPEVPPLGHDSGDRIKTPVWYVLYLLFVRTHIKFGIKSFEIDFVIEIKWYLTFWKNPGPQGVGPNFSAVAGPMHVSNSHTKFGWIWSNGIGGDSITDRPLDRI